MDLLLQWMLHAIGIEQTVLVIFVSGEGRSRVFTQGSLWIQLKTSLPECADVHAAAEMWLH